MSNLFSFQPTSNEWDAPITMTIRADGTGDISRGTVQTVDLYVQQWHAPHAIVLMPDGGMSPFDLARQPRNNR